jgi:2,3-dihydroxybenzoate-AMP ligase
MATPISEGVVAFPDEFVARYVEAGYWEGLPLGAHLLAAADRSPDAVAVVDGKTRLSYAELVNRADAAASRLTELGIGTGERIVVQLPNSWEFVVLTLACLRAGIVPVMALPAHRRTEIAHLAEVSEAAAIAVPDRLREFDHQTMAHEIEGPATVLCAGGAVAPGSEDLRKLLAPSAEPAADRARWDAAAPVARDVALFLISGGTTGLPKLIPRTHDDYAYNAKASAEVSGVDADTVYLTSVPIGHNFPLACPGVLGTLLRGGRVVLLTTPEPEQAFGLIAAEGVTHTAVVPAVAGRWLEHAATAGPPAPLRVLQVGGARLAEELARKIRPVLGAQLQQVFGMAEGLLNYTRLDDPEDIVCATQGRPLSPGDEVKIVNDRERPVKDGQPGVLLTRGPYTIRGYYRAPEQNARAFTRDGFFRTGDICRRTPEGYLVVEGRDKDMINRGGEKISAEEVENLLYRVPAVSQVAAVAIPDAKLGERICVYVVPHRGANVTLEDLRDSMDAAGVARFKLPEHLVVVDELKTTSVGKIDKKALRQDLDLRLAAEEPT